MYSLLVLVLTKQFVSITELGFENTRKWWKICVAHKLSRYWEHSLTCVNRTSLQIFLWTLRQKLKKKGCLQHIMKANGGTSRFTPKVCCNFNKRLVNDLMGVVSRWNSYFHILIKQTIRLGTTIKQTWSDSSSHMSRWQTAFNALVRDHMIYTVNRMISH